MTTTATLPGTVPAGPSFGGGRRLRVTDGRYLEILEFLWEEAAVLDAGDDAGWLEFLAPDIIYQMPVCLTRRRNSGESYESEALHFDEDFPSLKSRVKRFNETQAWAVDPAPRARRFVSTVRVWETETPGEYDVASSLLVVRSQDDEFKTDLLTAIRRDRVRAVDGGFQVAARTIVADQTTIGMHNLAIFL